MELLSGFILGIAGSFHCVGMCGPIALALPLNHNSFFSKISGAILYNFGRMFTYALLGGLFGLLGQSFVIAGYQQALSITLGAAILIMVLLPSKGCIQIHPERPRAGVRRPFQPLCVAGTVGTFGVDAVG